MILVKEIDSNKKNLNLGELLELYTGYSFVCINAISQGIVWLDKTIFTDASEDTILNHKYYFLDIFTALEYNKDSKKTKEEIPMQITKNSIIGDVLDFDNGTAKFFFEIGMHCLGCPASRGETIEQACAVHGTDADELIKRLNEYLASK